MNRLAVRTTVVLAALFVASLLVAACGDSKDEKTKPLKPSASDVAQETGRLTHIDGPIELNGSKLTMKPSAGGAEVHFQLGPEVAQGTVQALIATNARARVFYNSKSKKDPILAVAVEPAPIAGADAKTYDGTITDVSTTSITIDGDDGEKTFAIEEKDLPSFDVPHLEEHKTEGSPVRVYYVGSGDDAHAVAYEDA